MGKRWRIRFMALSLTMLSLSLMMSCRSVETGTATTHPPTSPATAPLTADSYAIKGKVTGSSEVILMAPDGAIPRNSLPAFADGPTGASDIDYTVFDIAIANARDEMVRKGKELGADLLLFPTYTVENMEDDTLKVHASAVAASLLDR